MRLYHPELDEVWDCPDDEGLFAVMAESGWSKTIPPAKSDNPALADVQPGAVYQLVNPEPEPATEPVKRSRGKSETTD